jgi:hypothetical protein
MQRGILKIRGALWGVYTYIQSVRKDRIRAELWCIPRFYRVARYMDRGTHGRYST